MEDKPIGTYLGDGKVELNEHGLKILIKDNINKSELISEDELLRRING